MKIKVESHALKHVLTAEEIIYAWSTTSMIKPRFEEKEPPQYISLGFTQSGKPVQMVGIMDNQGVWHIFHAMTPPQKSFIVELERR